MIDWTNGSEVRGFIALVGLLFNIALWTWLYQGALAPKKCRQHPKGEK